MVVRFSKLVALLAGISGFAAAQQAKFGAFEMHFREAGLCETPGSGEIVFVNPRISKEGRDLTVLVSNVTLNTELSDELGVRASLKIWGNGGWKQNFFTYDKPSICTTFKEVCPEVAVTLFKGIGYDDCPILKGDYLLRTPMSNARTGSILPSFPFGKYKVDFEITRDVASVGCIMLVVEVTPKKKQKANNSNKSLTLTWEQLILLFSILTCYLSVIYLTVKSL